MPVVRLPNGATAILCTRGRSRPKKCWECGRDSELLCDGPGKAGKTCDRPMCKHHATHVGPDRDLCRTHVEWEKSRAAL